MNESRAGDEQCRGCFRCPAVNPQKDQQLHGVDALCCLNRISRFKYMQAAAADAAVALLKLVADVLHTHLHMGMQRETNYV